MFYYDSFKHSRVMRIFTDSINSGCDMDIGIYLNNISMLIIQDRPFAIV